MSWLPGMKKVCLKADEKVWRVLVRVAMSSEISPAMMTVSCL
jgi:hypothetical protein